MAERTFLEQLDAANNEAEVRTRLAAGNYNARHASLAEEWLRSREAARAEASAAKRDAREEKTLAIAKEANSIARSQAIAAARSARWAMYAAIIAAVAAAITSKDQILALIFGNP